MTRIAFSVAMALAMFVGFSAHSANAQSCRGTSSGYGYAPSNRGCYGTSSYSSYSNQNWGAYNPYGYSYSSAPRTRSVYNSPWNFGYGNDQLRHSHHSHGSSSYRY